jgi:predicted flap endonuclease-1-like 5' DNA nuclease
MKRLPIVLSATALVVGLLGSTAVAATGTQYVPFVTDFPKPAAEEPFVSFVTDFRKPAAAPAPTAAPTTPSPAPKASTSRIDWGDVGIGSGIGAALAALLAGSGLALARRTRPVRS